MSSRRKKRWSQPRSDLRECPLAFRAQRHWSIAAKKEMSNASTLFALVLGAQAGTNRIERILGGCALLESWVGAGGSRGHSLNYYDASRGVRHQTWVDNQGAPLELEGRLEGADMVLSGETRNAATGATVMNRLTWTTAFDGLYARK
jgi:hypothetical protein